MAAAVADFRPAEVAADKIKRDVSPQAPQPTISLVANPDILAGLVQAREDGELDARSVIVGFAAETGDATSDALEHARAKLARKAVDLLVLNDVSGGAVFGQLDTQVLLLTPDGTVDGPHAGTKAAVADAIWDRIVGLSGAPA
jgi:phosphopantothenoylcysteine decarboxylase/phosphopantothenate--cysteine ligase